MRPGKTEETNASAADGRPHRKRGVDGSAPLSTKAARVGFDWKNVDDILISCMRDRRAALGDQRTFNRRGRSESCARQEEWEDLLFAATNTRGNARRTQAALKVKTTLKFRGASSTSKTPSTHGQHSMQHRLMSWKLVAGSERIHRLHKTICVICGWFVA